ncbi:hypothetical protein H101_08131, partial [Trichophyton interdigitale H6]
RPKRPRHLIAQLQCRLDLPFAPNCPNSNNASNPKGPSKYTRGCTRLETSCEREGRGPLWDVKHKQRFAGASLAPNLGRIGLPRGGRQRIRFEDQLLLPETLSQILDRVRSP